MRPIDQLIVLNKLPYHSNNAVNNHRPNVSGVLTAHILLGCNNFSPFCHKESA